MIAFATEQGGTEDFELVVQTDVGEHHSWRLTAAGHQAERPLEWTRSRPLQAFVVGLEVSVLEGAGLVQRVLTRRLGMVPRRSGMMLAAAALEAAAVADSGATLNRAVVLSEPWSGGAQFRP